VVPEEWPTAFRSSDFESAEVPDSDVSPDPLATVFPAFPAELPEILLPELALFSAADFAPLELAPPPASDFAPPVPEPLPADGVLVPEPGLVPDEVFEPDELPEDVFDEPEELGEPDELLAPLVEADEPPDELFFASAVSCVFPSSVSATNCCSLFGLTVRTDAPPILASVSRLEGGT